VRIYRMTQISENARPLFPVRHLHLVVDNVDAQVSRGGLEQSMANSDEDAFSVDDLVHCLLAVGERQDRKAFRVLFDHFAPRVKAYIVKLGSHHQQAEEVTQETMAKVWNKASQFDPAKAAPSTWIFRIARNQRIDAFRRENHPEFDQNDPSLLPVEDRSADLLVEQKQSEDQLLDALASLPEEQMDLLRLSFFEDMPHGTIAKHLGLPLGTVKSRLRLAMAKLRRQLDTSGPTQTSKVD
jgi:RNA polymerase sigma-70 factor, ECF subfamily